MKALELIWDFGSPTTVARVADLPVFSIKTGCSEISMGIRCYLFSSINDRP